MVAAAAKNAVVSNKDDDALRARGMKFAQAQVTNMFAHSAIADNSADYPKFDWSEIKLGKVLGKGGFGTVSEVRAFTIPTPAAPKSSAAKSTTTTPDYYDDELDQSCQFLAAHCLRENNGESRYALKILSPEVVAHTGKFIQGVADMAVETRFLSSLVHPNIIKMRATARVAPYDGRYFIVMDRLYDTLETRIHKRWAAAAKFHKGPVGRLAGGRKKASALYEERLVAAYDLAAAVQYMHAHRILYRDLKTENVGFDIRGDIKIFDFGLAKELTGLTADADGTYNLTADTGSPRYMAPEVALGQPYNEKCDCYSFAVMFWEMMTLQIPFHLFTLAKLHERVWAGAEQKRPYVDQAFWSLPLQLCLKRSWTSDVKFRYDMSQVAGILKNQLVTIRGGDAQGLEHNRRRSTFVFRPRKV